jgi:hypothetical protein
MRTLVATTVKVDGTTDHCSKQDFFNVVHTPGHLVVTPDCVIAARDSTVTLRFVNNVAAGKARTKPESGGESWLNRDNSQGNPQVITIKIDHNAKLGPPGYLFILEVDDTGTLDPRIVVQ